jgi:Flp pilus assembly protein TadG
MRAVLKGRRKGARGERGSALVEAAFITPLVFLVIFGILEFGWAFHDKLTVGNMSQSGARAASTQGNDPLADYQFVQAVDKAASALPRGQIQYVVLYKAASATDHVPASCTGGTSQSAVCNVYVPANFAAPSTQFGCGATALDRFWCPTSRKVASTAATGGPPDYVGVYVKVRHDTVTRLFGTGWTFTEDTVAREEARKR